MKEDKHFISEWMERINTSKRWRQENYDKNWQTMLDYYKGIFWGKDGETDPEKVSVNFIYSTIRIILPAIYSVNPYVNVIPRKDTEFDRKSAESKEAYINYLAEEIELETQARLTTLDALIFGHGWVKLNYEPKIKKGIITNDLPTCYRVSPFNIFIPDYTEGAELPDWVIMRIWKTEKELKRSEIYKDNFNEFLFAKEAQIEESTALLTGEEKGGRRKKNAYEIYEIWDAVEEQFCIILPEKNLILLDPQPYPFTIEHTPFCQLRFNEIPDDPYPVPECQPWIKQQLGFNQVRTREVEHANRARSVVIFEDGVFQEKHINALNKAPDMGKVGVPDINKYRIIEPPNLPFDNDKLMLHFKEDIVNVSGINEYQRGETPAVRTAYEVSQIEAHSRLRSGDKLSAVSKFYKKIVRGLLQISAATLTEERIIPIVGKEASDVKWWKVSPEDIKAEHDIRVEIGSSSPFNEMALRKYLLDLTLTIQNTPLMQQEVDFRELLEKIVKATPVKGLKKIIKPKQIIPSPAVPAPQPTIPTGANLPISPEIIPQIMPSLPATGEIANPVSNIIAAVMGAEQAGKTANLLGI